jgi:hypothetical protein
MNLVLEIRTKFGIFWVWCHIVTPTHVSQMSHTSAHCVTYLRVTPNGLTQFKRIRFLKKI